MGLGISCFFDCGCGGKKVLEDCPHCLTSNNISKFTLRRAYIAVNNYSFMAINLRSTLITSRISLVSNGHDSQQLNRPMLM